MALQASVIVPARNAAATLGEQLAALAAQRGVGPMEILVVDNGSTDGTPELVEQWRSRLEHLRLVDAGAKTGPSYARNQGISAAGTESILLCDADDVVSENWARLLFDALRHADAVSGSAIWVGHDGELLEVDEPYRPRLGFLRAFSGNNAAIQRSVWQAIGGFDEDLTTGEDLELAWRMQLAGYRLVHEERAVVRYRQRESNREVFWQGFQHGRGTVRIFERYADKGMPRSSTVIAVKVWIRLLLSSLIVWSDPRAKTYWCRRAGTRFGRLIESARRGVLFL